MKYIKTNTILDKICENKIKEIEVNKKNVSLDDLKNLISENNFEKRSFYDALNSEGVSLIAEIKNSSPSFIDKIFREDFDVAEIAKTYEESGARAISVITDERFFKGRLEYLKLAKNNCSLPILRKDFILDEYQIYEAKANGADAILLIATILEKERLQELYSIACELELDVLVEAHDKEDLEKVLKINPKIIGVNNRNLKTMVLDLNNFASLSKMIEDSIIKVAESGINNSDEVKIVEQAGADAILVGTAIMKSEILEEKIKEILCK